MATHSSILIWRAPWTDEPCGLQSMGLQIVIHHWVTSTGIHMMRYALPWLCSIAQYALRKGDYPGCTWAEQVNSYKGTKLVTEDWSVTGIPIQARFSHCWPWRTRGHVAGNASGYNCKELNSTNTWMKNEVDSSPKQKSSIPKPEFSLWDPEQRRTQLTLHGLLTYRTGTGKCLLF